MRKLNLLLFTAAAVSLVSFKSASAEECSWSTGESGDYFDTTSGGYSGHYKSVIRSCWTDATHTTKKEDWIYVKGGDFNVSVSNGEVRIVDKNNSSNVYNFENAPKLARGEEIETYDHGRIIKTDFKRYRDDDVLSVGKVVDYTWSYQNGVPVTNTAVVKTVTSYENGKIKTETKDNCIPVGGQSFYGCQESSYTSFSYDQKGNLAAKRNRAGDLVEAYTYSNSGNLTGIKKYDAEGNVIGSEDYKYDAGGNLVSAYRNGKALYLRKIYTIPEAEAATKDGPVNTVTFTW